MRLIDADRLREAFNEDVMNHMSVTDTSAVSLLMIEIDEIPTAYDVDKVIVNLMNSTYVDEEKCYLIPEETLAIVKRGGKDERYRKSN